MTDVIQTSLDASRFTVPEEAACVGLVPLLRAISAGVSLPAIYVRPLSGAEALQEVLLGEVGDRVVAASAAAQSAVAPPPGGRLLVLSAADAERRTARGDAPASGETWVVWGVDDADSLGWGLRQLLADGVVVDGDDPGVLLATDPWVQALTRLGEDDAPRLIVRIGEPEQLRDFAADARLRAEALTASRGLGSVHLWLLEGEGRPAAAEAGDVVVIREGESGVPADLGTRIARMVDDDVTVVLIGGEGVRAWATGAEVVAARAHLTLWLDSRSRAGGKEEEWPPLADMLVGAPDGQGEVSISRHFVLGKGSLQNQLHAADATGDAGHFVVFAADRIAWIGVENGHAWTAGRLGDGDPASSGDAIRAVVHDLASWVGQGVFVPRASAGGQPGGLPLDDLVFDLVRAEDERRHGRPDRAASAGAVQVYRPHVVASALIKWGLWTVAKRHLEQCEGGIGWGAEEALLLGVLSAGRDHRAAADRFREAGRLLARAAAGARRGMLQVDVTLNTLLLDVREAPERAVAAWVLVRGWLDRGGSAWLATGRHVAVVCEIAVRAGARAEAVRLREILRQRLGEQHPTWLLLEQRVTEMGERGADAEPR